MGFNFYRYQSDEAPWPNRVEYTYAKFNVRNPDCIHVVLSDRAYNTIIAETLSYDRSETGGVLIGYIHKRVWYVTEVIPPGIDADRSRVHFRLDLPFVNFLASKVGDVYFIKPTILGFWHRHPGDMDYFSEQDMETIYENDQASKFGLLSMLVNIDPQLRMTFYHARYPNLMPLRYDQGDAYFPPEFLQLATPEQLLMRRTSKEGGPGLKIKPNHTLDPDQLPKFHLRQAPEAPQQDERPQDQQGRSDVDLQTQTADPKPGNAPEGQTADPEPDTAQEGKTGEPQPDIVPDQTEENRTEAGSADIRSSGEDGLHQET
jgi:hypothetical protein